MIVDPLPAGCSKTASSDAVEPLSDAGLQGLNDISNALAARSHPTCKQLRDRSH